MKTPTEVYELLQKEFSNISLNIDTPSYENEGTKQFKQNNFDVFFSYSYEVLTYDYDNGDYFTPNDFKIKVFNLFADRMEVSFKGNEIVLTEEQYNELLSILTVIINK